VQLRPFFYFFGAKNRMAGRYPAPLFSQIVEPFAGSAAYSVRYYESNVTLYEIDPVVFGVWDFLIKAKRNEILRLPVGFDDISDLNLPQEAKWFLGFNVQHSRTKPANVHGSWSRSGERPKSFWGEFRRSVVADQVGLIRHWKIYNSSYKESTRHCAATWFIDPPYHRDGAAYAYSDIDYTEVGTFCRARAGQVIVCEQEGAAWLPFKMFGSVQCHPSRGFRNEVVYYKWRRLKNLDYELEQARRYCTENGKKHADFLLARLALEVYITGYVPNVSTRRSLHNPYKIRCETVNDTILSQAFYDLEIKSRRLKLMDRRRLRAAINRLRRLLNTDKQCRSM
jgi:hypothetical protein